MARDTWCKHYRGMHGKAQCEAGVEFEQFKGLKMDDMPCVNCFPEKCDKAEYPTPEEIAAEEAAMNERFKNIGTARQAIVAACGGPWKRGMPGKGGSIECPVCKAGKLSYSRAGYNGHIHAGCDTEGCVSWME